MTTLDDALVPAVFALIEEFGKLMEFEIVDAEGNYTPSTGKVLGGSVVTFTRKATPPSKFKEKYVNGDTIKESDSRIVISGKNLVISPKLNMKVTFDGNSYKGLVISPLYSGELVAAWIIRLRK